MQKFQGILVYAGTSDDGRAALREAVHVAQRTGARLQLIDVVKPVPTAFRLFASADEARTFESELAEERREALRRIATDLVPAEVNWDVEVAIGRAGVELTRAVLRENHDLVIKSADGEGKLRQRLFGSVGMFLVRNCPCPVWLVRPDRPAAFQRVLAAVDVESADDIGRDLNDRIVKIAASLATAEGAELHVVHAWHLWMERALRGRARFRPAEIDQLSLDHEVHSRADIASLLARNDVAADSATVHVVKGEPDEVVPEVVESTRAELLVMGTVCRTGVSGLLLGNTAERILNDVDVSVLTVKPRGFLSPVRLES